MLEMLGFAGVFSYHSLLNPMMRFWAYNGVMAKPSTKPVEVVCPCCQAKLTVDPELAVVLHHERATAPPPDVDISDAANILASEAQRREDKFRDSWTAEQNKEDVLARKFEEALKKAKGQPVEKPMRDFDL